MLKWFSRENTFTVISLALAALFGWGFFTVAGLPPVEVGDSWQLLVIFMIFFIMPFAKKLDFFQFFSFEAKIAEVRKEVGETKERVSDVREDVRHVIAQQNALSASVQSMNHQAVTVNNYDRPLQEQVEAATAEVADVEPVQATDTDPQLSDMSPEDELLRAVLGNREDATLTDPNRYSRLADLFVDIEDLNEVRKINMSERVAVLRIRVERELKRLVRPRANEISGIKHLPRRFPMPTRELIKAAMELYPNLSGQRDSFDVFFRIANAAVHADEVPSKDLDTAIYLGERLLSILTKIQAEDHFDPELPLN